MRHLDRREWLKLALKGSFGLATLSSLQLGLLPQALAAGRAAPDGYKALVCVFLFGGNDSLNMLLPLSGQSLLDYQAARQSLAVADPRNDGSFAMPKPDLMKYSIICIVESMRLVD